MFWFVVTFALLVAGTSSMTMEERLKALEDENSKVMRQVMLQEFYSQEELRSKGDSGLVSSRLDKIGSKNYYAQAHIQDGFMSMHELSQHDRTMGLGELSVVMNGVQFRTRHNDYKLRMPHSTSSEYHAMEDIPFPPVPKDVTDKATVAEQIQEMREYFKAFQRSDETRRPYKQYFKPVLCYLEGTWTKTDNNMEEPFKSDNHHIDANTFYELMDKVQFTAYTGSKSAHGNFALLPSKIYDVKDGVASYAQWNYRIACHPIKTELPRSAFVSVDDLLNRVPHGSTMEEVLQTPAARFILREEDYDHFTGPDSLLDKIMNEVPGADNYQADLRDKGLGMKYMTPGSMDELNTGYYHRYYKVLNEDGKTQETNLRGFNDANLWVAQTSQDKVAGKKVVSCNDDSKKCSKISIKYTYALPLEVVYMTPLMSWNPYNLREEVPKPKTPKDQVKGDVYDVTEGDKRNGGSSESTAFLGFSSSRFYKTPKEFYGTSNRTFEAGVLDRDHKVQTVCSAGSRILTPEIEGVGSVRLRYPIMPLHGEGSGTWKELNALREIIMHQKKYTHMYNDLPCKCTKKDEERHKKRPVEIRLSMSRLGVGNEHTHSVWLAYEQWRDIVLKKTIRVITGSFEGHSHDLTITTDTSGHPIILSCDGHPQCLDGHSNQLTVIEKPLETAV